MTSKEVVLRILEREGKAMRAKDIVERALRESGLREGQVVGALNTLKKDGIAESVKRGHWRIVAGREVRQTHTSAEPPNVAGLTGKEAVFQILAHVKRPLKKRDIDDWLEASGQDPLTDGQIDGAFYALSTNYLNVVEKVRPGTYRIHKKWNGEPLERQVGQQGRAVLQSASKEPRGRDDNDEEETKRVVIPCFGLHWERSLVSWSAGQNLLGAAKGGDAVNFANQTGVYVLYQWPQVNYVGRTVSGGLYQRLKSSHVDPAKGLWDRFSWFGLSQFNDDGQLQERRGQMSVADEVTMMEALLINVLTPPHNNNRGNGMGVQYFQVPDPTVEEREQEALAGTLNQLLEKAFRRSGRSPNRP